MAKTALAKPDKPALQEQLIPVRITFDPFAVNSAKTTAIEELNRLQGATIDNDAELEEFAGLLRETVAERKLIETMRESVLGPIKAALKTATESVDALFKPALQAREASERQLRKLVGDYQQLRAAEERKQIAAARDAAAARQPEALQCALVAASAAAPGKLAGVGVKEVWAVKRIVADLVPYDWCVPDEKRIAKHARETPIDRDPTPVPGVLFERVAQTTVRS